ncbi:glutamine amidotransferase [Rhodovulum sulfidophilum]|uniref:glutamine amidotransferase n=1 Tax=Rhodovulum sulfidophilum TaxID=35806 RepID=UPI001F3D81A4|nr:glutamine amidotransferase [Rhodovulum sulfidophilum]MCE8439249.1 glutamine amidotransferase [Rhodovulum sulfidophilum]
MTGEVIFDPLLPLPLIWALAVLAAGIVGFALWRGLAGWWLRGLAALAILAALANPSLQTELRTPLSDIVVLVVDESASQRLSDRPEQTARAVERVRAEVAALDDTELRILRLGDGEGDEGTLLMTALSEALAEVPRARLAGAILLTDGQLHDLERAPALPAPLHALLTGRKDDWDRRLLVQNAPAFAILGEEVTLTLKIEDQGAVPKAMGDTTSVTVSIDGGTPQSYRVPVGQTLDVPVVLDHAGQNVIQFSVAAEEGELTERNNAAVVQINGVRDRLRVLLVSGEPHPGERTWRNLLKSDSSVDLVHFTILRPPDKHDGVPVSELSLIAFPTRELFLDKIDEFDLIIFDRYKRRGILPSIYFDNVRNYVEKGGALLIAAGPDFAGAESIYRSPLADILPAEPSARVIEQGYRPEITDLGRRHPVTEGLKAEAGGAWGRWFRLIDLLPKQGEVVMSGIDDRPLLVLDRVGEGRVALLASDHAWLWSRGFEGGGPQLELLRRLAHWMMKEPELEEEALSATAEGQVMTIIRRSLSQEPRSVEIARPDGGTDRLDLVETAPGRFAATYEGPEMGLYRLTDGTLETVIALGPAAPREFEQTIADGARLEGPVSATRGGIVALSDGMPDLRRVREGRTAHGRGWLGITPRAAYLTSDVTIRPLAPAWVFLLLAALLSLGGWLREGRR